MQSSIRSFYFPLSFQDEKNPHRGVHGDPEHQDVGGEREGALTSNPAARGQGSSRIKGAPIEPDSFTWRREVER